MNPDDIQVFFGEATPVEARVYSRWSGMARPGLRLAGTVRGPTSALARTLPVTIPLVERESGGMVLSEATIPDPCFWTPDEPYWYTVDVEARDADGSVVRAERMLGIRPLGVTGRKLVLASKRWVLRAVTWQPHSGNGQQAAADIVSRWRSAHAALVIAEPSDDLCAAASRKGVLVVADLTTHDAPKADLAGSLNRLAQWPAVGMAIVRAGPTAKMLALLRPPNLILAKHVSPEEQRKPLRGRQPLVADVNEPTRFAERFSGCPCPVIARRLARPGLSVAEARAECDALQRDLAPHGDFAGYIV